MDPPHSIPDEKMTEMRNVSILNKTYRHEFEGFTTFTYKKTLTDSPIHEYMKMSSEHEIYENTHYRQRSL